MSAGKRLPVTTIQKLRKIEREYLIKDYKKGEKPMRKLGNLTPGCTTCLHSPKDGVRMKKKTSARSNEGIIGLIMKKKRMKSWHDNV